MIDIQRSKSLEKLLLALKEEDSLFDYNVPANIRTTYSNEDLSNYLQKTYSQERFVLDDPKEVIKYVEVNDKVIKKGDYKNLRWQLEKDTEGIINKVKKDGIYIRFNGIKEDIKIEPTEIDITGFYHFFTPNELYIPTRADKFGIIKAGLLVKYIGERKEKLKEAVLDGTEGIVAGKEANNLFVIWAKTPGLKQQVEAYTTDSGKRIAISANYKAEDIILVRVNTIDYKKLHDRCFGD